MRPPTMHRQPSALPPGRPSPTLLPSAGPHPFKLGTGVPVGPARAGHCWAGAGRPVRGPLAHRTATLIACHATYLAIGPLTSARITIDRRRGTVTRRRLGCISGGAGRRAPGDHGQVGTRMLVTTGHRRHVTRWPLMTPHETGHATRPSAFRRDPAPRARLAALIIPAPVTFSAVAFHSRAPHGSFPLATARPVNRTRIFQPC